MTKPKKKLTLKQEKFAVEYLKTGNGAQAARKAGYSPKTARVIAQQNLSTPAVRDRIESAAEKTGITPEYVLKNYKNIADYNAQKVFRRYGGEFGSDIEEMRDANVAKMANDSMAKHLNMFTDKVEVTGKDGAPLATPEEKLKSVAMRVAMLLQNPNLKK